MGDDGKTDGRQLAEDDSACCHAERLLQSAGSVQLLFHQFDDYHQRADFIAGARTMVLTTKIKQLQYVNRYNEVFVLSLLILFTNLAAKLIFTWLAKRSAAGRKQAKPDDDKKKYQE